MTFRLGDDPVGPAIVRILAGTGTAADEAELRRWLDGGPDRARELDELRAIWAKAGTLQGEWSTTQLQRRILQVADSGRDVGAVVPLDTGELDQHHSWPARFTRHSRVWLPVAAAAVLLLAAGLFGWRAVARSRAPQVAGAPAPAPVELVARPGQRATFPLPDGSWVVLAAGSRLRYAPPLATGRSRDVALEGEAYFAVAPDSTRPFRVHAGHAVTRVLGTHFGVRAYPNEATVRVVVAEGKVGLGSERARTVVLGSGEQGALGRGDTVVVRAQADVARALAWAAEAVFADAQAGQVVLGPVGMDTLTQEHRMRFWNRSIAGLILALPTPTVIAGVALAHPAAAAAQAVTPADLVGTWANVLWRWSSNLDTQYVYEAIFTFRTDSTWSALVRRNGIEDTTLDIVPNRRVSMNQHSGRWRLVGDTLLQLLGADLLQNPNRPADKISIQIARRGEYLLSRPILDKDFVCTDTLRHIAAAKPLPPPSIVQPPITIDPAALVGTWMWVNPKQLAGRQFTDTTTMVLHAGSTLSVTRGWWGFDGRHFSYEVDRSDGTWKLFPGDVLATDEQAKGGQLISNRVRIALQGQQLIADSCVYANHLPPVYKRASP